MLECLTYEWRTYDGGDALEEKQKTEGIRQSRGPHNIIDGVKALSIVRYIHAKWLFSFQNYICYRTFENNRKDF